MIFSRTTCTQCYSSIPLNSEEQVVKHDQAKSPPLEPHALCQFHGKCKSCNAERKDNKFSDLSITYTTL